MSLIFRPERFVFSFRSASIHPDRSIAASIQAATDRSFCTGKTVAQDSKNIFAFTLDYNFTRSCQFYLDNTSCVLSTFGAICVRYTDCNCLDGWSKTAQGQPCSSCHLPRNFIVRTTLLHRDVDLHINSQIK